jgi:hypothetical protein
MIHKNKRDMKSNLKTIALVIAIAFSGVGTAAATDTVNVNSNSNVYLAANSAVNFNVFMNKKAKKFIKRNNQDWSTFNKVVRLYNTSTSGFLNLTSDEKADFANAVSSISGKLEKMNKSEATLWLKKVDVTEKVFNFIWDNNVKERPFNEIYELPIIELHAAVGK